MWIVSRKTVRQHLGSISVSSEGLFRSYSRIIVWYDPADKLAASPKCGWTDSGKTAPSWRLCCERCEDANGFRVMNDGLWLAGMVPCVVLCVDNHGRWSVLFDFTRYGMRVWVWQQKTSSGSLLFSIIWLRPLPLGQAVKDSSMTGLLNAPPSPFATFFYSWVFVRSSVWSPTYLWMKPSPIFCFSYFCTVRYVAPDQIEIDLVRAVFAR